MDNFGLLDGMIYYSYFVSSTAVAASHAARDKGLGRGEEETPVAPPRGKPSAFHVLNCACFFLKPILTRVPIPVTAFNDACGN